MVDMIVDVMVDVVMGVMGGEPVMTSGDRLKSL